MQRLRNEFPGGRNWRGDYATALLEGPQLEGPLPGRGDYFEDVYRDDPYRYDDTGADAFSRVSQTDDLRRIDYLPTPAEIAGVCAQIRSGWTMSEKRRRYVGELPAEAVDDTLWVPPVIDTTGLRVCCTGVE